jgi:hypothetical protein
MKKILLAAGAILIPAMTIFAQDYTLHYADQPDQANPSLKTQFAADFPDAKNVHYAHLKNLNEVSFVEHKEKMNAYYGNRGQLIGTIQNESFDDLPENAQREIQAKYPGYAIANVVKFDDRENDVTEMILYGRSLDDADNYFVELKNDSKAIVVKVDPAGGVNYFTKIKASL